MDEKTIPLAKLPVDVKVQFAKKWDAALDYRVLFEQMGECVFIVGLDLRFITANPQALKLLGYNEGEILGLPVDSVILLDEDAGPDSLLEGNHSSTEQTLKKKDASLLPVELTLSVVHNTQGQPAYIQMLARDISERKQSEKLLKRHTRALSVIGEVTAGLFRSANIEDRIPEALESLGFAVNVFSCAVFEAYDNRIEVNYQWIERRVAGFSLNGVLEPFRASLNEAPDRVFSITDIQTGNDEIPVISLLVIPIQGLLGSWGFLALIDKDDRLAWLPSIFDIVQTTANLLGAALERVHYEENLRLSETRNRVIVDALPDLILRVDLYGRILDYSANAQHPLHLSRETVIGKKLSNLWTEEIAEHIIGADNQYAFTVPQWVESFKLEQSENTFEARLYPISHKEALIIVRDITEQARLNQMKSDFINRASHELRTPITAALLMTELIQQGGPKEELDEYWKALTSELNRQKNLINQLLTAGRLESGSVHLEVMPLDLIPALEASIQSVKPIAHKHNIPIHVKFEKESIRVLGDQTGLQQVFINLIGNAIKFSREGTSVDIKAGIEAGQAYVAIRDHGLGIPPESIPHLFERFYRARNVTLAEISGSGIGLYIVKSIMDELGGSISVESRVNEGAEFTVRLKLATNRANENV